MILFGDGGQTQQTLWAAFLDDALECVFNEVRNASLQMLGEFKVGILLIKCTTLKRAMYDLQSAQVALFRKELPEYLLNFEFGPKFVKFVRIEEYVHN